MTKLPSILIFAHTCEASGYRDDCPQVIFKIPSLGPVIVASAQTPVCAVQNTTQSRPSLHTNSLFPQSTGSPLSQSKIVYSKFTVFVVFPRNNYNFAEWEELHECNNNNLELD